MHLHSRAAAALSPLLLVTTLLGPAQAQGSGEAIFLGSSTSGSTDPWWMINPNTGAILSNGNASQTNNCSGAAFARGGQDLIVASGLNGTCADAVADGLGSLTFVTQGTFTGGLYGIEADPFHQRYLTMQYDGSGYELQVLDGNPASATYGSAIATSTNLNSLGLLERWGMDFLGETVVAVPALFNGSVVVVDTDPDSATYLEGTLSAPASDIPGISIGADVEVDARTRVASVLIGAPFESVVLRYNLNSETWIDADPFSPGVQHITIPLGVGTGLELLPGGEAAIVCGRGHSTQNGWVGQVDFATGSTPGSFTEFSQGLGLFEEANSLSLSPNGARSFISAVNPYRGLILDNATGTVLDSIPLPGATGGLSSSAWRGSVTDGDLYCSPANPNSTGQSTTLITSRRFTFGGIGTDIQFHLEATSGPPNEFGFFLVSTGLTSTPLTVGDGLLCLALPVGRYNGAGGVSLNSLGRFSASGMLENLSGTSTVGTGFDVPTPMPNPPGGSILPGTTWAFQLWHRDAGATSNMSDALVVQF